MQSSHPRFEMLARHRAQFLVTLLIGVCLGSPGAWASSGGGLPWEAPLEQIQQSITGPVAGFIALSAVAVAGGMLIFGGELNDFARRLMYVVLVAGILLGASQIVGLFGATGASLASSSSEPDEESLAQQRSAVTDTVTLTQSVLNQPHQAGRVV